MEAYVEPYLDPKETADAIFADPKTFVNMFMAGGMGHAMDKVFPVNFPDIKRVSQASWEAFHDHMLKWISDTAQLDEKSIECLGGTKVVLAKIVNASSLLYYLDNI